MPNKLKALLVYPEFPDTFWSMKHAVRIMGKKSTYPPLGLMTVSSLLGNEWEKKLIDLNVEPLTQEQIDWADYIFISAMNVQIDSVRDIIKVTKQRGKKIVAGGTLFTHEYHLFPEVDHFVLNEGEITLPNFLNDLKKGSPQKIYSSDEFANVQSSPLPDWEIINPKKYSYAIVQYSRGCPYNCDFCDVTTLFGRNPRVKTPGQIISELDIIVKEKGFNFILFADDNLIGNRRKLMNELLPKIIEWRKTLKSAVYFHTQVTVNLADDEKLMSMMLEAGFRNIFVGIETPDEESLKLSRKTQNLNRDLIKSINKLHSRGFIVVGGFIVGFDNDDENIFERQYNFIQESGIVLATVNILKSPPGTALYERMKKENRLIDNFSFQEYKSNFRPVMDSQILENGFRELIQKVYSPEFVYQRIKKFLNDYSYPKLKHKTPEKLKLKYLLPFINSVLQIGIKSDFRKYFWSLFFWTIKNKRKYLDHAMLNTIMMYQLNALLNNYKSHLKERELSS